MQIRPMIEGDFPAVVALNQASVTETSPLGRASLARLAALADLAIVLDDDPGDDPGDAVPLAGFLLALREEADYDNRNFRWFQGELARFLYIDRIVVHRHRRQAGVGSQLYGAVERHARTTRVDVLTCEVNLVPPNPGSLAFHAKRGFREVGRLELPAQEKLVSLLTKRLFQAE